MWKGGGMGGVVRCGGAAAVGGAGRCDVEGRRHGRVARDRATLSGMIFPGGTVHTRVSNIAGVLARVFADDLDAAIPCYERLAGEAAVRFGFRAAEFAWVRPFLPLSGHAAAYRDRVATLSVRDLVPVLAGIEGAGGRIAEGPSPAPSGRRPVTRHPGGSIFEYIESGREPRG